MRKALPSLVIVPFLIPTASGGIITPDTAGNILVPEDFSVLNGQDFSIHATGGSGTAYTAFIARGVVFTGELGLFGMAVEVDGYIITNNGSLSGSSQGINATAEIDLTNNGILSAAGGPIGPGYTVAGVVAFGGATSINNNADASISSSQYGIILLTDGGSVTNHAGITGSYVGVAGLADLVVDNHGTIEGRNAITGTDRLQVRNDGEIIAIESGLNSGDCSRFENVTLFNPDGSILRAGSVTSSQNGALSVSADVEVVNNVGGVIRGGGWGISASNLLEVHNRGGEVSGTHDGIMAWTDARIHNENATTASGEFHQGVIRGDVNGVRVEEGAFIENAGLIRGGDAGVKLVSENGVSPTLEAEIVNTGSIRGSRAGVDIGGSAFIRNSGEILASGSTGIALDAYHRLVLVQETGGTIIGNIGINTVLGPSSITNSGLIRGNGGTAIALGVPGSAGLNTIELKDGGVVIGDIIANGTGNSLTSSRGYIHGDVSGVQEISVEEGGSLALYGDVSTPAIMKVGAGAAITGTGDWQTAGVNLGAGSTISATISYSPYMGLINIAGDVTHAAGSIIHSGIQPSSPGALGFANGVIRSTSGVYDATAAIIDLESSSYSLANGSYIIVAAGGGTVLGGGNEVRYYGREDSVLGNFFASTSFNFLGDFGVDIIHDFASLPGLDRNQRAAGAALDAFISGTDGIHSVTEENLALRYFINGLDAGDLANARAALGAMAAPAENALALTQSVVNGNHRANRMVQDHLAAIRSRAEVVSIPVGASAVHVPAFPTEPTKRASVWGSFSYDWQDYEGEGDFSDFDGETASFTGGVDYRVAPDLILGLLLDGSKADIDGGGADADIESFRITAYGTWGGATGLYSDFLLGYGDHDNDFTDATSIGMLATIGYAMGDVRLKHGPYAGLEYQNVDVDGFQADASLPLPVDVDDFDVESFRALIGYRVNANLGRFTPYASLSYAHEFEDGGNHTTTSFGAASFRVEGGAQGSAILLTAGTGIALTPALTLDLGYRGEISVDSEGMDSHGGNLGVNWAF